MANETIRNVKKEKYKLGGRDGSLATISQSINFLTIKDHVYQRIRKMIQIGKQAKDGNSFQKEPANCS